MPTVRYIGKGNKIDSVAGVGLAWEEGQTRNVSQDVAERLLAFPDTWERADDNGAPQETDENAPAGLDQARRHPTEEPLIRIDEPQLEEKPLVHPDFHGMNKDQMRDYAEQKFNIRFDKRMPAEEMRVRLQDLQSDDNLSQDS